MPSQYTHKQVGGIYLDSLHPRQRLHLRVSTERLSCRHTAPLSFVLQALANPITVIRQSGKIDGRSQVWHWPRLSLLAGLFHDPCYSIEATSRGKLHLVNTVWCGLKPAVIPKCQGFLFYFVKADNKRAQVDDVETDRKLHVWHC